MKNEIFLYAGVGILIVALSSRNTLADALTSKSSAFNTYNLEFKKAAAKYGISWLYVKAIAWNESSVGQAASVRRGLAFPDDREGSKSSDGKSWGIMQVTLPTANDMRPGTTFRDLNNPAISIDLGAKYLSQMLKRYAGDVARAVRAYNQGPGNEDNKRPFADEYLARFNTHYQKLIQLHG